MSKILLIGDVHLADRPPSSCTESYTDDLFELLNQALTVAFDRNVDAIVQAGDLFHIKMPSRNSHKLVLRTNYMFASAHCPVFVVPGNHDMMNDRLASVWESQPLGAVLSSKYAFILNGWMQDELGLLHGSMGLPIFGIPWLQDWDAEPEIADKAVENYLQHYRGTHDTPSLVITHAPFYPPGQEPPYESYDIRKFADAMGNHGSVYYGHIHEPHGVYISNGVQFCNNGALSRGSLTEYNLQRQVGVTLWDSVTDEFEFIPLDSKPADEVFRVQEAVDRKTARDVLDGFLASVGSATLEITSLEAVMTHVKSLGLNKRIEELVEELLQ